MPNFTVESKLYTSDSQEKHLDRRFYGVNKMYNTLVTHANEMLHQLYEDDDYKHYLELYANEKDENVKKEYGKQLSIIRERYGLNKNAFEAYINVQRKESLHQFVHSDIGQKIASRVWQAASSCLFGKGKKYTIKK